MRVVYIGWRRGRHVHRREPPRTQSTCSIRQLDTVWWRALLVTRKFAKSDARVNFTKLQYGGKRVAQTVFLIVIQAKQMYAPGGVNELCSKIERILVVSRRLWQ